MAEMEVTTTAYEVIEKIVKSGGNSGRVYVPKSWRDKKVKVLLIEPIDENKDVKPFKSDKKHK